MSLQTNPVAGMNHPSASPAQRQPNALQDPETVKRNYHAALYELTFNSKPIITNLTIMAQENQHAAAQIVREIEQQIKHNSPDQKLPVLYLIDSICKNIGGVYIAHFARNITQVFLDAYKVTDPQTRRSFERLLQTWKNGMPNGAPVFPRHVIEPIERSIHYIRQNQPQQYQHQQPRHHPNYASYPQVPHQVASSRNQQIHVNPNFMPVRERDPRARRRASPPAAQRASLSPGPSHPPGPSPVQQQDTLSSLKSLLPPQAGQPFAGGAAVPPPAPGAGTGDPVSQILSQIQAILPALPSAQASSIQQHLTQILGNASSTNVGSTTANLTSPIVPTATPPIPPVSSPMPVMPAVSHTERLSHPPASTPPPLAMPAPPVAAAPAPVAPALGSVNALELLKGLTSMGILSSSGNVADKPAAAAGSVDAYGQFRLDSKDLQIVRPGAVEVLYSALPLQCKQCGFRYPKTDEGQSKMDAHLDSHFRQNRRMKERVKRGLSRSWFVSEDEWIKGTAGELASHQAPAFISDQGNSQEGYGTPQASAAGADDVNPDEHMVVKPNEDRKPCPICGERFIEFWNDDEEEWMYKNAVIVNNIIYHATCRADAVRNGTLLQSEMNIDSVETSQLGKRKLDEETGDAANSSEVGIKLARTDADADTEMK
ncbi:hypothetical protein VTP01DRAFT_6913 [Rhizomucor pusillus]|uniref:uncharacterized protein n=1 Tax=Rhizomucor pusillus TaxID=4840 RepID=UPI003742B93F